MSFTLNNYPSLLFQKLNRYNFWKQKSVLSMQCVQEYFAYTGACWIWGLNALLHLCTYPLWQVTTSCYSAYLAVDWCGSSFRMVVLIFLCPLWYDVSEKNENIKWNKQCLKQSDYSYKTVILTMERCLLFSLLRISYSQQRPNEIKDIRFMVLVLTR